MTVETYAPFQVPVEGGDLHVGRWGTGDRVVIGVHGITGNHMAWAATARALGPEVTLIAPDLRGRGRSNGLPGPFGVRRHVQDLRALLDHLGLDRAVLAGHSMGAYIAALAGVQDPGRWHALVLVDGGIALPLPDGVDPDSMLAGVLGPALARLSMDFESPQAYLDFWRKHPAFADQAMWTDDTEAGLLHDLTGEPPRLRSSAMIEAVRADGTDVLVDRELRAAHRELTVPSVFLRAERGLLDEVPGLFPDELVDSARASWAVTMEALVGGTNHYSILLSPTGAKTVASHISAALDRR